MTDPSQPAEPQPEEDLPQSGGELPRRKPLGESQPESGGSFFERAAPSAASANGLPPRRPSYESRPARNDFFPRDDTLPRRGAQFSEPDSALPKRGEQPSQPGNGLPQRDTDLPQRGSDLPKRGDTLPQRSTELPKRADALPQRSTDLPQRGGDQLPQRGTDLSQSGSDLPQRGDTLPQRSTDLPQRGSDLPQRSTELPQRGSDPPQRSTDLSQSGSDLPQRGTDLPQRGGDQLPQRSTDLPQRGSDPPQRSTDLPQRGGDQLPQRATDLPQRGSDPPQRSTDLPQRGGDQLPQRGGLPQRDGSADALGALPRRTTRTRPAGRHRSPHRLSVASDAPALVLAVPGTAEADPTEIGARVASIASQSCPGVDIRVGYLDGDELPLLDSLIPAGREQAEQDQFPSVIVPLLLSPNPQFDPVVRQYASRPPLPAVVAAHLGPHPMVAEALHSRLAEAGLARQARSSGLSISSENRGIVVLADVGEEAASAAGVAAVLLASRLSVPVIPASLSDPSSIVDAVNRLGESGARPVLAPCLIGPETNISVLEDLSTALSAPCAPTLGAHQAIGQLVAVRYGAALARLSLAG